jgi:putative effector of murein hydrolase
VAHGLGGVPALTAVIVLSSGVLGAMVLTPLCKALGITDPRTQGFGAGVAAHGIGMARAYQLGELAGAFGGIGMAANAVLTAVILSLAAGLI